MQCRRHGGLRRAELGEDKLQGLDFMYTITGQLKAVNHPSLEQLQDPAQDGSNTFDHEGFAADSFSIALHYHPDDFVPAGAVNGFYSGGYDDLALVPQYDENIAGMEVHVGKTTSGGKYEERSGESYRYDQLGRLDSSRFHTWDGTNEEWNDFGEEYLTTYEYDANGNIVVLERRGYDQSGSTRMDSLTYHYQGSGTNKLDYVGEAVAGDPYSEDIGNTQSTGNYAYDEIGNLTEDLDEGGMAMEWDAYGKVKTIDRSIMSPAGAQAVDYTYDAGGNRVRKVVRTVTGPGPGSVGETFYVYGAGGVVVAIYEKFCDDDVPTPPPGGPGIDGDGWPTFIDNCPTVYNPDQRDSDGDGVGDACDNCVCTPNPDQKDANNNTFGDACEFDHPTDPDGDTFAADHDNCPCAFNPNQEDSDGDGFGDSCDVCAFHLVELPIYGLGRVGVAMPDIDINNDLPPDTVYTRRLNRKFYELTDQLGNVRVVLGDRKRTATPGAGNYYAEIRSYAHPYPFGMPQPGRTWDSAAGYRYGFNGMETDPEVKEGIGQHYTTYFRQYDPRLGRWWSTDPVVQVGESPYAAMFNNPILYADSRGDSGRVPMPGGGGQTGQPAPGGGITPNPFVWTDERFDRSRTQRPIPVGQPPPPTAAEIRKMVEQTERSTKPAKRRRAEVKFNSAHGRTDWSPPRPGILETLKDFLVAMVEGLWVGVQTIGQEAYGRARGMPPGMGGLTGSVKKFDGTQATPTERVLGAVAVVTTVAAGPIARGVSAGLIRVVSSLTGRASTVSVFSYAASQAGDDALRAVATAEGAAGSSITQVPSWVGSGPAPGVLGVNSNSVSIRALLNYRAKGIEFVFDTETGTFVVGRPPYGLFSGSPHQQLAATIRANESTVLGGTLQSNGNGIFLTNEASGHFFQNWNALTRNQFQTTMNNYGFTIQHGRGF